MARTSSAPPANKPVRAVVAKRATRTSTTKKVVKQALVKAPDVVTDEAEADEVCGNAATQLPDVPLTDRLIRVIERELNMIEKIVHSARLQPDQRTEAEHCTRMLASLARTLTGLSKVQSANERTQGADDHAALADPDAFRLDLAQRLGVLVAEAKAAHPDEDQRS
jgi:hypothetical protein